MLKRPLILFLMMSHAIFQAITITGINAQPIYLCKAEKPMPSTKSNPSQKDGAVRTNEASWSYLGQTPPGNAAVIFGKGVVSKGNTHSRLTISPDGQEMFWTVIPDMSQPGSSILMHTSFENGKWTEPRVPPFAAGGISGGPQYSPDGKKLFFNYSENSPSGRKTLYVEKTCSGWSEPKNDGVLLKSSSSFTKSGLVYFLATLNGKVWNMGIYCARYTEEGYGDIQPLDSVINSPYIDYTPYISPEDDYLLFSSSRPSTKEDMSLCISFKNENGTWASPQKMDKIIGFLEGARFPSISPDGKYIFFCGDDGNIYWVSRDIVAQFKP